MRPLGSDDRTFDRYMINLAIMCSLLSLVFKIQVGASCDIVYGSKGREIGGFLGRLLALWRRGRWIAWFYFRLCCLSPCCRIRYLQGCRRVGYCWLRCGIGLCVGCNYMASSIVRGIYDSLIGILVKS
jgi:hypothetical protein